MGNHERAVLDGAYPGSHRVAQAFFGFCYPRFKARHLIEGYVDSCIVGDYRAVHTIGDRYVFADTPVQIERSYLIGHSHHAFIREIGPHRLVNVGSVGQNRRDLQDCCYVVHGPGPGEVRLEVCRYDAGPVIDCMRRLRYPEVCLNYYLAKLGRSSLSLDPPP
jgi:hypothetical protein